MMATLPLLALGGCGSTEDPGIGFDSRRGSVLVVAMTTGTPLPVEPYTVEISDIPLESERPSPTALIDPNGEVRFQNLLAPSVWTVTIRDIPAACAISGEASREVAVGAGRETTVTYEVTCGG